MIQLGAPEESLPALSAFSLIAKGVKIGGSLIGPPGQIREMLDFAVKKGVHPIIQERSMGGANEAVVIWRPGRRGIDMFLLMRRILVRFMGVGVGCMETGKGKCVFR